jgi:hypothetical protein
MQLGWEMWRVMFAHCLGHQTERQKIIEIKYAMALVGRQMASGHKNQSKMHRRNQGGKKEEVRLRGSTGGDSIPSI